MSGIVAFGTFVLYSESVRVVTRLPKYGLCTCFHKWEMHSNLLGDMGENEAQVIAVAHV